MVALLKGRGLSITDSQRTEHYIRNIGYYRLSAYYILSYELPKKNIISRQEVVFKMYSTSIASIKNSDCFFSMR